MKEILEKLQKIYEEKKRRKLDKLANYNKGPKIHNKQVAFHKCTKRNRWVFGGNRTGKTECGAVEVVYLARGCHPYKQNKKNVEGWVVSLSKQVQRDVAQKKVLSYIPQDWIVEIVMLAGKRDYPENGVIDFIRIKNVFGGVSTIGFKSCDQGREKFQGTSLDFVWFDEEPPEDIYVECKLRVMDRCGEIFGTMTPLKGLTWVYNEIYLNQNNNCEVWFEQMEWSDNPFLSESEIEHFEQTLSKDELESRKFGRFSSSNGLVYAEFDENFNVVEPFDVPKDWFDNMSIDPGLNNPLSCHWYAVDYDGNVFVIAEHFWSNRDIDFHVESIKAICERLGWPTDEAGNYHSLIDSAANQHSLNGVRSVAELFAERGIVVNTSVNKDLFSGIAMVKSYIKNSAGQRRLFVFKNCTNLIRELKSYFWGDGDNPVKRDDHCLDELRYYLMSRPKAHSIPINDVAKRKNQLARLQKKRRGFA